MKKIFCTILLLGAGLINFVLADELLDITYEISDLHYQEKNKEALAKADAAIAKYPNEAELYYLRGSVKNELNSPKSALADFEKAIQLNPKYDMAYFWTGVIKQDLGSNQSAYIDLCRCLQINPENSNCYAARAAVRLDMGDFNGFNSDLEKSNIYREIEMKKLDEELRQLEAMDDE